MLPKLETPPGGCLSCGYLRCDHDGYLITTPKGYKCTFCDLQWNRDGVMGPKSRAVLAKRWQDVAEFGIDVEFEEDFEDGQPAAQDFDGDGPCSQCGTVFKMKFSDAACPHCSHRMSWQEAFQACAGYRPPPANVEVPWVPGMPHPDAPNVIAGDRRDNWQPAPGYTWVTDEAGDFRVKFAGGTQAQQPVQDHLQFLCLHCLSPYHAPFNVGDNTRCPNCGKVFTVCQHLGNQDSLWRQLNLVGGIVSMFAGAKCPACKSRGAKKIGREGLGQRVVAGELCNVWLDYYLCEKCYSTWFLEEGCNA
jgi:DNA-directed RNA polymerase subunit RPC12/RpoP